LIEKAEAKCREAKELAEKGGGEVKPSTVMAAAATADATGGGEAVVVDVAITTDEPIMMDDEIDLYDGNPQSILLSTMSSNPEKAQRETALLFPALKFLWEVYRAVLDILKSNSKLERLYHGAAVSALRFCAEYKRRVEFRRLCDMMRMHLGNLTKYGGVNVAKFEDGGKNNKVRVNNMPFLVEVSEIVVVSSCE